MKKKNGEGNITQEGYKRITLGDGRRIFEHRYIVEQLLGRPLLSSEKIHHLDRNKLNNDPKNLEVLTQSQHIARHRQLLIDTRKTDGLKIVDWTQFVPPPYREKYFQKKICLIEHCQRKAVSWHLCRRHATAYQKWRTNC